MRTKDGLITLVSLVLFIMSFISLFIIDYSWGKSRSIGEVVFLMSPVIYLFVFPLIFLPMKNENPPK